MITATQEEIHDAETITDGHYGWAGGVSIHAVDLMLFAYPLASFCADGGPCVRLPRYADGSLNEEGVRLLNECINMREFLVTHAT